MLKEKKGLVAVLCVLAVLLGCLMGAKPLYNLYRDVSFSWQERSEAAHKVKDHAERMGVSFGEYPWFIIELLENNPETEHFVFNYPFREAVEFDLSTCSRDTVPLFLQWDTAWGYEEYGSSIIAVTGCGPTALSMAGYYLTGDENMSPEKIAKFAQKNGYYEQGIGSSWTLISEGTGQLGLKARELPLVKKKMVTALEEGSPVILALGPGDFTTAGHYIVLTGVEEGKFRVNDPNSVINSEKLWSYEELEPQIRNIWAISK